MTNVQHTNSTDYQDQRGNDSVRLIDRSLQMANTTRNTRAKANFFKSEDLPAKCT